MNKKGNSLSILIDKNSIYSFGFCLFALLISFIVSGFYISGDQYHYINFYESSRDLTLIEVYALQLTSLGSADPGYSFLVWLFSSFVSKDTFISVANAILAFLLYKVLRKYRYPKWFIVGMLLSFYMFVLFFAAERLKFGVMFVLIAFLYKTFSARAAIILIASLFHVQALFALIMLCLHGATRTTFFYNLFKWKNFLSIILIALATSTFIFLAIDQIYAKFLAYSSYELLSLIKPIALGSIGIIFFRDKFYAILTLIFFLALCFMLGTDRVIMMQFMLTLLLLDYNNKIQALVILILFIYLFFKTIDFVYKIYVCGEGFLCLPY